MGISQPARVAKQLLEWNRQHLIRGAKWEKDSLALFFLRISVFLPTDVTTKRIMTPITSS